VTPFEQVDFPSILRKHSQDCFHHATTTSRLPKIIAAGSLLSPQRLGETSDRWGANSELGQELVCCGFRVHWGIFKKFRGEESVILSFDASALSALPGASFSPYNTAKREAEDYLNRNASDQRAALLQCLQDKSRTSPSEFVASEIPLSTLRSIVFCDQKARESWSPVVEAAMGSTVPSDVRIFTNGELPDVPFPRDLEVTTRTKPLLRSINRRGGYPASETPERADRS
jgi:hypothetical protein